VNRFTITLDKVDKKYNNADLKSNGPGDDLAEDPEATAKRRTN
jgi:hypothetical protein